MANLKPAEVAERLGISVKTLQRWDREGILKAYRTPTDRRYYTQEQIDKYMNCGGDVGIDTDGIVDRGYKIVWRNLEDTFEFSTNDPSRYKVYLINTDQVNEADFNEFDSTDILMEEICGGYTVEYSLNGIKINESVIYNVVLDYIISEFENGDDDAAELIYGLLNEHSKILEEKSQRKSKIQKLVKNYLIELLNDDDTNTEHRA